MEPVKVPQNLELKDVLVWGLGAMDLVCLAVAGLCGWWLYLAVPASFVIRLSLASPVLAIGLLLGLGRLGDRTLREWLMVVVAYLRRPQCRVYGRES
jgi:PrgI family protein